MNTQGRTPRHFGKMSTRGNKIEIYKFEGNVKLVNKGRFFNTNRDLTEHIEKEWSPKRQAGWDNAWMPLVKNIIYNSEGDVKIKTGFMNYTQASGCIDAIKKKKSFAPNEGVIRNVGVGLFPLTNDGYLILNKRDLDAHAGGLVNEPSGYMCSRFSDLEDCSDVRHVTRRKHIDTILNIKEQAERRMIKKEFKGIKREDIKLDRNPSSLCFGYQDSFEGDFGMVARLDLDKKEFSDFNFEEETYFVPVEELRELIMNQGELINVDAKRYKTDDIRKLPLLDLTLGGLVGGVYESITNEKFDLLRYLRESGLDINIKSGEYEESFSFPMRY